MHNIVRTNKVKFRKFSPLNYVRLCKPILRLHYRFIKKTRSRIRATNRYINMRHMRIRMHSLLSTTRQLYYSRHLFVCNYLINLLKKTPTYAIGQGLVQKKIGFQNLRNFFSQLGISVFLLARKDINYLRAYGTRDERFTTLFFGGYTFIIYPNSHVSNNIGVFKNNLDIANFIREALSPFFNFYKFYLTKQGLNLLSTKAIDSAKLYPLVVRFGTYFFSKNIIIEHIEILFSTLVKIGVVDGDFSTFFTLERAQKIFLAKDLKLFLESNINIQAVVIKNFMVRIIIALFQFNIEKIKLFLCLFNSHIKTV